MNTTDCRMSYSVALCRRTWLRTSGFFQRLLNPPFTPVLFMTEAVDLWNHTNKGKQLCLYTSAIYAACHTGSIPVKPIHSKRERYSTYPRNYIEFPYMINVTVSGWDF